MSGLGVPSSSRNEQRPAGSRGNLFTHSFAQYARWWHHLRRMPWHISFTLAQPVVWLLLFGNLMKKGVSFPGTAYVDTPYLAFMLPGVVAFTIFGNSLMSAGIPIMFDRENGFLERLLTTPISRSSILLGRWMWVSTLGSVQVLIILGLGALLGVKVATGLGGVLAILVFGILLGGGFSILSLSMAFLMHRHDAYFAATNFLGMPLMFLSSALVPAGIMPENVRIIAQWNPMTFGVDAIRSLVLQGWDWPLLLHCALALLVADLLCLALGARVFRRHLY